MTGTRPGRGSSGGGELDPELDRCARACSVYAPGAGYALERVFAAVGHLEAGSDDEVLDGLRDQHFAGVGEGGDARADVDREPADVTADPLDLAGVQSDPNR